MDDVCRWINRAGTSIEFEFEASILNARENSDAYRARLRDYMRGAKQYGIYGSRPIAYYQGSNALYDLWVSDDPVDREPVPRVLPFRGRESAAVEMTVFKTIKT